MELFQGVPVASVRPGGADPRDDANHVGPQYTVRKFRSLAELPAGADALFDAAGTSSFFLTQAWFANFEKNGISPDDEIHIYAAMRRVSSNPVDAVLLMRSSPAGTRGRKLTALSSYYSPLFDVVSDPRSCDTARATETIAAHICRERPRWDVVDFHPLNAESPYYRHLVAAFRRRGVLVDSYWCFGNWYLDVAGRRYAEYFSTLPSRLKNTLKRKRNLLNRVPGSRIVMYQHLSHIEEGLEAYRRVYAASWKRAEPYPSFIPELCRTVARGGGLRLAICYIADVPAAAQIWIVHGRTASIYKLAHDEQYSSYSPGSILTACLMEQVIDVDRVSEVDYLTGDDDYKRIWMSGRRDRSGIVAFNLRTVRGGLAASRHVAGRMAKRTTRLLGRVLRGPEYYHAHR